MRFTGGRALVLRMFLIRVERGIFPWVFIWFRWRWKFVEEGNKLGGGCPRGEGKFFFDNLSGIGFREARLVRTHTTCLLIGGEMMILDVSW